MPSLFVLTRVLVDQKTIRQFPARVHDKLSLPVEADGTAAIENRGVRAAQCRHRPGKLAKVDALARGKEHQLVVSGETHCRSFLS